MVALLWLFACPGGDPISESAPVTVRIADAPEQTGARYAVTHRVDDTWDGGGRSLSVRYRAAVSLTAEGKFGGAFLRFDEATRSESGQGGPGPVVRIPGSDERHSVIAGSLAYWEMAASDADEVAVPATAEGLCAKQAACGCPPSDGAGDDFTLEQCVAAFPTGLPRTQLECLTELPCAGHCGGPGITDELYRTCTLGQTTPTNAGFVVAMSHLGRDVPSADLAAAEVWSLGRLDEITQALPDRPLAVGEAFDLTLPRLTGGPVTTALHVALVEVRDGAAVFAVRTTRRDGREVAELEGTIAVDAATGNVVREELAGAVDGVRVGQSEVRAARRIVRVIDRTPAPDAPEMPGGTRVDGPAELTYRPVSPGTVVDAVSVEEDVLELHSDDPAAETADRHSTRTLERRIRFLAAEADGVERFQVDYGAIITVDGKLRSLDPLSFSSWTVRTEARSWTTGSGVEVTGERTPQPRERDQIATDVLAVLRSFRRGADLRQGPVSVGDAVDADAAGRSVRLVAVRQVGGETVLDLQLDIDTAAIRAGALAQFPGENLDVEALDAAGTMAVDAATGHMRQLGFDLEIRMQGAGESVHLVDRKHTAFFEVEIE